MLQESHLSKSKFTLIEFGMQLMLSQDLENNPQVTLMLLRLRVDQDVVNDDHYELILVGLEHPMHEIHECRWSIRQSEWHYCELKVPILRPKRRLRDICLLNPQVMVTSAEIYLGVNSRSSQLIKLIINPRQWVPIPNSNPIQLSVVYA